MPGTARSSVRKTSSSRAARRVGEVVGERDAPISFDATVHLCIGDPDERFRNGFRCELDTDVAEELRLDPGREDLAVDEHPVTIEDVERG